MRKRRRKLVVDLRPRGRSAPLDVRSTPALDAKQGARSSPRLGSTRNGSLVKREPDCNMIDKSHGESLAVTEKSLVKKEDFKYNFNAVVKLEKFHVKEEKDAVVKDEKFEVKKDEEEDIHGIDHFLSEGIVRSTGNLCVDTSKADSHDVYLNQKFPNTCVEILDETIIDSGVEIDPCLDSESLDLRAANYWREKQKRERKMPFLIPVILFKGYRNKRTPLYGDPEWFDSTKDLWDVSNLKSGLNMSPFTVKLKCFTHWPEHINMDLWDNILKFQRLVELKIDKRRSRFLSNYSRGRLAPSKKFSCSGCMFKCDRISGQYNHQNYQRCSSGLVYKCKRCGFSDSSKCVINSHVNRHSFDGMYNEAVNGGMYCWRCMRHIRCKSIGAHKELVHTLPHNMKFQPDHLKHWREWFQGK